MNRRINTIPGKKRCPKCEKVKRVSSFAKDKNRNDGRSGWCRKCRAALEKTRRDADPVRARPADRSPFHGMADALPARRRGLLG